MTDHQAESDEAPYAALSPDRVLDALEAHGWLPSGGLLELNSYENRVYQVELDGGGFVVTKFYRPARWSDAQIREEHGFTLELAEAELPVVAPLARDGETLFGHGGFRFAVFPRQGGRAPDLELGASMEVLARTLARLHSVGRQHPFEARARLTVERMGWESRQYLLDSGFVPAELEPAYAQVTENLLRTVAANWPDGASWRRIHGDCHLGNLLWRDDMPHFVDFDDCVTGPAVQDLWMLLSGSRDDQEAQLKRLLDAYQSFTTFDSASLALIEPLRTLRMLNQAAWIGRRWHDPAFPRAFPWFGETRFWSQHILELREQEAALSEPPLRYLP